MEAEAGQRGQHLARHAGGPGRGTGAAQPTARMVFSTNCRI